MCFGLMGRQVLAQHSCYRDTEWGLLRLSIIRFATKRGPQISPCGPQAAAGRPIDEQPEGEGSAAAAAAEASEVAEEGDEGTDAEVISWVQRSGGDLVRLEPADYDDEDTAAVLAADGLGDEEAFAAGFPQVWQARYIVTRSIYACAHIQLRYCFVYV